MCAAIAGWMAAPTGRAQPTGELTVGPNVQVSRVNGAVPHMEVVACADAAQPSTLLVGSMASLRGVWVTFLYRSTIARTWTQVLQTSGAGSFGDPTCAFGPDGRAYYGVLWSRSRAPALHGLRSLAALVYTSQDRGRTWPLEPAKQMGVDRPFLAAGQSGPYGRYVYYTALLTFDSLAARDAAKVGPDDPNVESGIAMFVSVDSGNTFALAAPPRQGRNDWIYGIGNPVVTDSGDVVTVFRTLKDRFSRPYLERGDDESTLSVLRAGPDGSLTEPAITVGAVRGRVFPGLAIDASPGSFHNRLYAVALLGASVVSFWSGDEGRTWHGPVTVRDALAPANPAGKPIVFNPSVAVNRDGVVAVGWAEGTNASEMLYVRSWRYRMAASWNGGRTFSESVAVSSDSHDTSRTMRVPLMGSVRRDGRERQSGSVVADVFADSGGHTFGLTAGSDGVFHPAWTDNRTGVSQVWTAAVHARVQ